MSEQNLPEEFNIYNSHGEVVRGPFNDEVLAHNALRNLLDRAVDDDECIDFYIE